MSRNVAQTPRFSSFAIWMDSRNLARRRGSDFALFRTPAGSGQLDDRELIRLAACAGGRRFRGIRIAPTGESLAAFADRHDRSHYGIGEFAACRLLHHPAA